MRECQNLLNKPENAINYYQECTNLLQAQILISNSNGDEICAGTNCDVATIPERESIDLVRYDIEYLNPNGLQKFNLVIQVGKASSVNSLFKEVLVEVSFLKVSEFIRLFKIFSLRFV